MLWTPTKGDWKVITNDGVVGTTTPGTQVTTGASASTKGSAAELISAANNTQDSFGILVTASNVGVAATTSRCALDILIGGATDDVLIPNLLAGNAGDFAAGGAKSWFFPLHIPSGLRIAAQAASDRLSANIRVSVSLFGGSAPPPWRVGRKVTTYGMGTVPGGTAITPGASGAAQAEAQVTASTSEDHFAFLPSWQINTDTNWGAKAYIIGVGAGAASGEKIGQWWYGTDANEMMAGPWWPFPAFYDLPSGSRLSIYSSASGANESNQDAVVHAIS